MRRAGDDGLVRSSGPIARSLPGPGGSVVRTLAERFEAKVDRSGEHHVWTGSAKADGTGKLKIDGKTVSARRVAWELAHGSLPQGVEVRGCAGDKRCVRVEHLTLGGDLRRLAPPVPRGRRGSGSMRQLRPGCWKLTVTAGRHPDGSTRRAYRTVYAQTRAEAARLLAAFVAEVGDGSQLPSKELRDLTIDEAMERFLTQHLLGEKGRAERTVVGYRKLHRRWFSPVIGHRRVNRTARAAMDDVFGRMQRAGLSRSQLNQARSLYTPFFRWARQRGLIDRSPMADFELPTSRYVSRERTPPEVEQLCLLLRMAGEVVSDVAPLLVLGAVTGMRRGELVSIRQSRIHWEQLRITVDAATDGKRVTPTKTRRERSFYVDADTIAMLHRHCAEMDELAAAVGVPVHPDPFVFSTRIDRSEPMAPDHATKRVAFLKAHLGIEDKSAATVAREDEALRLFRGDAGPRKPGTPGPRSQGALSYREIGERLGRTDRWAAQAVRAAERREAAQERGDQQRFDGSILALRKFTSSELLDAGFNISMVARRQGHGPQVLAKHYAKSRPSADRKAADYLGRIVHRQSDDAVVQSRPRQRAAPVAGGAGRPGHRP